MTVRRRVQRYKDGTSSTRWLVDIEYRGPDGSVKRVRRVSRVQSRVGAERLERELRAELEGRGAGREERPQRAQSPTLAVFWERFNETHVKINNKPSEQWTKGRIMAGHLLPAFGAKRLDEIRTDHIEEYKARLVRLGYKAKTVNNHLTVLRTILRTAVEWCVLLHSPKVKLLRVPKQDVVFLDFSEAETLVASAEGLWKSMIIFALNTGLRIGELLALRWQNVSFELERVRVSRTDWLGVIGTPKSGQACDVPLNLKAMGALQELQRHESGLVFCAEDGRALTYRQANWALEQIVKRGVGKAIGWHTLRHTFASHLVMRNAGLTAVQQLLGHSTQAMTERYAHLTPQVKRDAVAMLDQ